VFAGMQSNRDLLTEQWRAAAKGLSVRFEGPFLDVASDGKYTFAGLLPDFGGGRGTLIDTEHNREAMAAAKADGFTVSFMQPNTREPRPASGSYAECLIDWGWSGSGHPPDWCSNDV
jgi:hypothetical protein